MNSEMIGFSASALTVADLSSVQLTGSVSAGGNDAVVMTTASGNGSAVESDDTLGLANSWNTVEFDIFGDGGGSEAKFSAGTSISVKTVVNDGSELAPESPCPDQSFTAETNNLNMAPTAAIGIQPSPTIISDQTTNTVTGTPSCASASGGFNPPSLPPTVLGQWNTTYQNNPRVSIWTSASDAYTITADTPVEVSGGSSCYIPVGTTLATFSGSGTSYSGQHNLFYNSNCSLGGSTSLTLTLDGDTLTGDLGNGGTVTYTKITSPVPSLQSVGLLTFQTYTTTGGKPVPVVRGCTATVVDSPNFSTIVTAGHCVAGSSAFGGKTKTTVTDLQFAPAHTGECWNNLKLKNPSQVQVSDCGSPTKQCPQCENPYGVWYANSSDVYSNYINDNSDDFAFIVLAPDPTNGPVESIVGGVPITFDKNDGGTSDPEQAQSWAVSAYAADEIDFAKNSAYGFGPFECDTGTSPHVTPNTGEFGEVLETCSFINPITGAENGFSMPDTGMPFGSSGGPWVNAVNSGTGAYTLGAVEQGGAEICGSGGSCDAVFGTVLSSYAKTLWSTAGSATLPIRQVYSCSVGGEQTATVSAQVGATAIGQDIDLSRLTFSVTNPTTDTITVTAGQVSVPDPNNTSAPYVTGSATVAKGSTGWTAGHNSTGIYGSFSGSMSVGPGETVSTPAFSAAYSDLGPAGTVINWTPGAISITVASPIEATVTCTPSAPVGVIASVTE